MFTTLRIWIYGLLLDLAGLIAPYPTVVILDDDETWGIGSVWLITTKEYERICAGERCDDVFADCPDRLFYL